MISTFGLEQFVTNFGNITVAGPLAALVVAWVWWAGPRRLALTVAGSVFCALALALLLRGVSRATGGELTGTPFYLTTGAPSGHATTSTVIYGAIALLFAAGTRGVFRAATVAAAVLVIGGVAVTRVTLHAHSPADVLAGLLLGGVFAVPVALVARRERHDLPPMVPLLLGVVLAVVVMQWSGIRFESAGLL